MPQLGRHHRLIVSRCGQNGVFLNAGKLGEAFLPPRLSPADCHVGDELDVFLYLDTDDTLIASTQIPKGQAGEVVELKVSAINNTGAFLDWGLGKELLLPHGEQNATLEPGDLVLVRIYLDQRGRLVASMRLDKHLKEQAEPTRFAPGQSVSVLVVRKTELGLKCVVDHDYWGMIYSSDLKYLNASPRKGQRIDAFIRRIRPDSRLDISLTPPAQQQADALGELILEKLAEHDGFLAVGDKTSPEAIFKLFKVSKKVFKKALSQLYKERRILITDKGIALP